MPLIHKFLNPTKFYNIRVEVWRRIFVRNVGKCGKKNFHSVFLTYFWGESGESRWIMYFHSVLRILTKKNCPYRGSNLWHLACLQLLIPLLQLSLTTSIFLVNLNQIEKTLESKGGNFLWEMQWISRLIFVRNGVECGEIFF